MSSAGTHAVIGSQIHDSAAAVLRGLGGDASDFSARQLTARIATGADLILAMTRAHRDAVLELAPNKLHKTFTLPEASRIVTDFDPQTVADLSPLRSQLVEYLDADVPDPIGQGVDVFEAVGATIAGLLPPVLTLCARTSRVARPQ